MLEYLQSLDISLFRFINGSLQNPVLDFVMPVLTDLNQQRAVLAAVLALLLWMLIRGSKRTKLAALVLILTIIFTDQLNSSVLKFLLERARPCRALYHVHLLVGCGGGYSFPSSHAVNNFAGAVVLSYFFPRATWWCFGFAATIAFSRVYVGVHYPSDVLGGAVIGIFCAACILFLFDLGEKILRQMRRKKLNRDAHEPA